MIQRRDAFGYFESDDLERAAPHMAVQPVSTRWQDRMAPLLSECAGTIG
jgi:L-rhamnose mutarotase